MATTTLPTFLRDRRARVHPATTARRRTAGLRREEVAARAGVSVTWYTWLEQGRGGVPSGDVLERLSLALELDDTNREMLFLLAHDRPPPRKPAAPGVVTPSLQCVLDNLSVPAFVKTPTFQIVAWNRVAVAVLGDYAAVPERDRNLLRRIFQPGSETKVTHVDEVRRTCLASFRVDIARAGPSDEATALIDELMETSPDFRRLWAEGELRSHGGFQKRIVRPEVGEIVLDSSVFKLEGSDGLSMFVFSPANEASARAIATLMQRVGV
ncbi:transcriptional regulator [Corallococcus sp. H22C18031201]|nr:helix-turn-helix transcriptional regulator [Citreicoccus inhibens]RJS25353.1 transcriptional regulator [Corallococcus sp. H22C18031201]